MVHPAITMNSLDLIPTPSRPWLAWGDPPVGDSLRSSHFELYREVVSGLDRQFFEKLDVDGQLLRLTRELTLETGVAGKLDRNLRRPEVLLQPQTKPLQLKTAPSHADRGAGGVRPRVRSEKGVGSSVGAIPTRQLGRSSR